MTGKTAIAAALIFTLCANIRLGCVVSVDGKQLEGRYSKAQLRSCRDMAEAAGEEFGFEKIGDVQRKTVLSFWPVCGEERYLTDMLMKSNPRIERGNTVYYNGKYIGCVEDKNATKELLQKYLPHLNQSALEFVPAYIDTDKAYECADLLEILADSGE